MSDSNTLPSRFQIGDEVIIRGTVKGVRFSDAKVSYEITTGDEDDSVYDNYLHIDSAFVEAPPPVGGALQPNA